MSDNELQTTQATPIAAGPRGMVLQNMDDASRFAKNVYDSGIAPSGHKNAQSVFVAMQLGMEMGLPPMVSIQNIMVVNGRPAIWGDAMLALCRRPELFDEKAFVETLSENEAVAQCSVRRLPDGNVITRRFSMDDASRAGLTGKDNWKKYPRRMLQMRARSWALKDAFPDLLLGLLSAEEATDIPEVGGISDAARDHIEHIKAEREAMTHPDLDETPTEPPSNPPTPEEVIDAEASQLHRKAVDDFESGETATLGGPTADQIAVGREIIERIGKCVSEENYQKAEDDAVALGNDGRLSQADCVEISRLIAKGRAGLTT